MEVDNHKKKKICSSLESFIISFKQTSKTLSATAKMFRVLKSVYLTGLYPAAAYC